jgi:hypothetical protein
VGGDGVGGLVGVGREGWQFGSVVCFIVGKYKVDPLG